MKSVSSRGMFEMPIWLRISPTTGILISSTDLAVEYEHRIGRDGRTTTGQLSDSQHVPY